MRLKCVIHSFQNHKPDSVCNPFPFQIDFVIICYHLCYVRNGFLRLFYFDVLKNNWLSDRFTRIDQPYNDVDVSEKEKMNSNEAFNETAYLCGEVSLFGDETLPRPKKGMRLDASNCL